MKQSWSFVLFPDGFSLIYTVLVWSRTLILLMSWSWLVGAVLATTLVWGEGCLGAVRPLIPPDAAAPPRLLSESFICREIYIARRRCGSQQIYRVFSYNGCVSTYVPAHIHRGGFILIQGGGVVAVEGVQLPAPTATPEPGAISFHHFFFLSRRRCRFILSMKTKTLGGRVRIFWGCAVGCVT